MAAGRRLGFLTFIFNGRSGQQTYFASPYQISLRSVKPLQRYRDFCDFHDGSRRHVGFSKIRNFNDRSTGKLPINVSMPKFIKIGDAIAEIWRFNSFQNGGRPPSWICWAHVGTAHDD